MTRSFVSTPLEALVSRIDPLDASAMAAARNRQNTLTKPPGSLGRLESASISELYIYPDGPLLTLLNDTCHLANDREEMKRES